MAHTRIPSKYEQGNDLAERLLRAYAQDDDVIVTSSAPGFSFYHPMTPTQARELAVALTTYADVAEAFAATEQVAA